MNKINISSSYLKFDRKDWAALRNAIPLVLSESELSSLQGINNELSLKEVEDIYLPLSRLINYYINSTLNRQAVIAKFLGKTQKVPYIIGITGSVAVGKSTIARLLQALLSRWPEHRNVSLVTTDGFLYPNSELTERDLMQKKGFPESYNIHKLLHFLTEIKSGHTNISAPVYSHLIYDIVPGETITVNCPDILIVEGLNLLQHTNSSNSSQSNLFVSDYLDFSIFVDADPHLLYQWYIERFLKLRAGAFSDPNSYFHHYSTLPEPVSVEIANTIWKEINERNLVEHILPTKERADLILKKGRLHKIESVSLRK